MLAGGARPELEEALEAAPEHAHSIEGHAKAASRRRVGFVLQPRPKGTRHRKPGLISMIRKLASGEYRLYSRKIDPNTGKRKNLGTFPTREAAQKHEREVQYFKRH